MTLFLRAPISPLEPQHNHFTSLIVAPKVILKPISLSDDPVDCLSLTPSLSTMPEEIVSHISRIVIDNGDGATVVRGKSFYLLSLRHTPHSCSLIILVS